MDGASYFLLFLLSVANLVLPSFGAAPQCGKQAHGAKCATNLCCSQFGFCGIGDEYCAVNCQSGPCGNSTSGGNTTSAQCGKQANGATCPNKLCCSQFGYCGSNRDFCGAGCQNGPCTASQAQCGKQAKGAKCANNLCCSQFGFCGTGSEYCAVNCQSGPCSNSTSGGNSTSTTQCGQQAHAAACPKNMCCSQFGYCGSDMDFCGAGCQNGPCANLSTSLVAKILSPSVAPQCGKQAGGSICPNNLCCSQFGFCGSVAAYCGIGCQSGPCSNTGSTSGVGSLVDSITFDSIFPERDPFYAYDALIRAATSFPSFGSQGDADTQRREIAAFLAHAIVETDGLLNIEQLNKGIFCDASSGYPCVAGQQYYGRGPLQLQWNFNYAQAGKELNSDLLGNPGLLATNATKSFEGSLWFWMTGSEGIPACHDAMVGTWKPSATDEAAKRLPGFGVTLDIVNGNDCGKGSESPAGLNKIKAYKNLCKQFGVSLGDNIGCANMQPF